MPSFRHNLFQKIKNSKGFTVLEVLVAGGMVVITGLAMLSMMETNFKGNKNSQEIASANELAQMLNVLFGDTNVCNRNFGPAPGQNLLVNGAILTADIVDVAGAVIYDVNNPAVAYQNGMWLISSYSMNDEFLITAAPAYVRMSRLDVVLTKANPQSSLGTSTIVRSIRMWTQLTGAGGAIVSCHSMGVGANDFWRTTNGTDIFNTNTGGIGLGTTTPRGLLDVNGAVRLKSGIPPNDAAAVGLAFEDNGDTGLFMSNYASPVTGDLNLFTNAAPRLTVLSGGNVGINTTAPQTNLHVEGHVAAASAGLAGFTQLWNDNSVIWRNGNVNGGLRFGNANDLAAGGYSQKMIMTDAGRLGIGIGAPQTTLDVNGTIRAGVATIGGACSPEGAMAYDTTAHAPIYCDNTSVWKAMGGGLPNLSFITGNGPNPGCHHFCTLNGWGDANSACMYVNPGAACGGGKRSWTASCNRVNSSWVCMDFN